MFFCCENCNINCKISILKNRLNSILENTTHKLYAQEIVTLSQLLDKFIYKCSFCSKYFNSSTYSILKNNDLNSKLLLKHDDLNNNDFIISLIFYICDGIKNNQLIYLSMDGHLYEDILKLISELKLSTNSLILKSLKPCILFHSNNGPNECIRNFDEITFHKTLPNYSGFRWISHLKYAINNTNINQFYNWEMDLQYILKQTKLNSSLTFVYKEYTIENEKEYINEPIINVTDNIDCFSIKHNIFKGLDCRY